MNTHTKDTPAPATLIMARLRFAQGFSHHQIESGIRRLACWMAAVAVAGLPIGLPSQANAETGKKPAAPSAAVHEADRGGLVNASLGQLQGVVVVGSYKEFKPLGVPGAAGVTVKGPAFLAGRKDAVEKVIAPYLHKPLTETALGRLQVELILLCRRMDRPVVDVFYPEQEIADSTIQVIVYEGKVGKISVVNEGKAWFSDSFITNRIHLKPGEAVSQKQIITDIERLNQNPVFREVNVSYKQGKFEREESASTDIDILVKDRFPLQVSGGYNNYGLMVLGENQVFAGFSYGNVFGLDHQINYQYTTDISFNHLQSHSASYVAPLPWGGHSLVVFGGYNDVKADMSEIGFPGLNNNGHTYQISARYTAPLPHWFDLTHELAFGFDFKDANTAVLFNQASLPSFHADVDQFVLDYRARLRDQLGYSLLGLSGYYSPGELLGLNTDKDFETFRPGLKANYCYGRVAGERGFKLPVDFLLLGRGTYQLASTGLLPSEQVYLGGYSVLRGYPQVVVSDDDGWYVTAELHAPLFKTSDLMGQKVGDFLDVFGFYDYGAVNAHGADSSSAILASAGAGLAFRLSTNLKLNFTYGFELRDLPVNTPKALKADKSRGDVSVVLSF